VFSNIHEQLILELGEAAGQSKDGMENVGRLGSMVGGGIDERGWERGILKRGRR
jgi:hypothetical protein